MISCVMPPGKVYATAKPFTPSLLANDDLHPWNWRVTAKTFFADLLGRTTDPDSTESLMRQPPALPVMAPFASMSIDKGEPSEVVSSQCPTMVWIFAGTFMEYPG